MSTSKKKKRRTTLADVARASGVSKTTASLILNDKSSEVGIAGATSARVWRTARRLGYSPSWLARALVTGRTHLVGILTVRAELLFGTHYGPQLMRGFTRVTGIRGYNIVVLDGEVMKREAREGDFLPQLIDRRIEGLIALTGDEPDTIIDEALIFARQENLPVVEAWHSLPEGDETGVCVDNDEAVEMVVARLWQLGHRNIALIVESRNSYGGRALERGFRAAMERRGMSELPVPVLELAYEEPASSLVDGFIGERLASSLPTAFFVAYDDNAIKIARELKRRGLAIPEDVSIIGYGNDPVISNFEPALASVDLSLEGIGEQVGTILFDWIESGAAPGRQLWRDIELLERSSIAPPREEVVQNQTESNLAETLRSGSFV